MRLIGVVPENRLDTGYVCNPRHVALAGGLRYPEGRSHPNCLPVSLDWSPSMIENCRSLFMVRSAGLKIILLVIVVHLIQSTVMNLVIFPSSVLGFLQQATFGLVNSTLQANLLFMLIVFPLIFVVGGLKPKDVALSPVAGAESTAISKGIAWTLVALVLVHVFTLLAIACGAGPLQASEPIANGLLSKSGIGSLGLILGQVFGNALYEEVLFRGFLIPQLLILFKKRNRKWSWSKCFWLSLLISQVVFSVQHIPNLLHRGLDFSAIYPNLLVLFVCGLLLAVVFLMTRNLYAAVGVHAVVNYPPMLIATPIVGLEFTAYFVIVVILLWNRWNEKQKSIAA
ncbi:MAG: lysostaphin resistance A-like protein [Pirellulaceae bacterium]